ncbi:sensor histidine kinase YpdA [Clostridium puniceum]|uniref:Sensor histidine kinase YpdA n=1 Tax=Clostridium puniceum TaxID=29367 RepID=A0A1S8T7N0_9CLOT|nr:histidine kinase [Clostridium puniceum]OOM73810.1 sensor histidine kinase YpdA [Clostridium puniceum]
MMKKLCFLPNLNFKTKLLLMICFFNISLVLLISSLNYKWYSNQITRQTINETQQIIDQIGVNIDNYIDELFRLTLSPYYNDEIMEELKSPSVSVHSTLNKKRKIENFLSSVMTLPRNEILRVYVLTDSDIYSYIRTPYEMNDYYTYQESNWYKEALQSTKPVYIPIHSEKVFGNKETQIFSIARKIRSKEDNSITLGVIKVDADYTGIKSICDKVHFENKGSLFVINGNHDIVYQNNALINQDFLNMIPADLTKGDFILNFAGNKYIINVTTLETSGLKVIAINSYEELMKTTRSNLSRTIMLVLICIIISVIIFILFIQEFFHPLFNIIKSMKLVQNGDLSIQVPVKNKDEIGYLAISFNKMLININDIMNKNSKLIKEVYESQYLNKESQYNALYSQIKPHFLYNTLNTISLLIKCEETNKAVQSIENLSCFMRGIMNTSKEISLEVEIKIIDSYLELQQMRYGEKLTYSIEIELEFLSIKIPTLSLQPIVENAVKHGCELKRGNTHIHIYSISNDESISILVTDNGKGIDPAVLSILNKRLEDPCQTAIPFSETNQLEGNIGLINVHRRLRLKYGNKAGLKITSVKEKGTTVILHIPIITSKEEDPYV